MPHSKLEIQKLQQQARHLEVINRFATILIDAKSTEDIVWAIAKNAIAQLGYVDCVIYLLDEKQNILIQRAAHGPKNPIDLDILNPIKLEIGQGVVGSVAKTGQGEIVTDTSKDKRYVIDDDMRLSEIAVPIIYNKKVIGVIDSEHPDRNFYPPEDLEILTTIANMAATKLVQARHAEELRIYQEKLEQLVFERTAELERQKSEITDSIEYARTIQTAILPTDNLLNELLGEFFVLYKPKQIVAGDFYWAEQRDDLTFLAVADCTGHGVPGAMVSVVCSNALNRSINEFNLHSPDKILDKCRELIIETFSKGENDIMDGMDISLSVFNKNKKEVHWSGANNPIWIVNANGLKEIKPDKQSVGQNYNKRDFTAHKISLSKGDIIYLFSDGYADQFGGEKGKRMKYKRFAEIILSLYPSSMPDQKNKLQEEFDKWRGDVPQLDDVCIVGVKI